MSGAARFRLVLTVLTASLLLLSGAPAQAAPHEWHSPAPCASGAFTGVTEASDEYGLSVFWVTGWIEPCEGTAADSEYGFIYFSGTSDGYVFLGRLRVYASTTGPTQFNRWLSPPLGTTQGGPVAICLAHDYQGRVACIDVTRFGFTTHPVLRPIAVEDPRVAGPVFGVDDPGTAPNCANCA